MKVEKNVVISEFIVNMDDPLYGNDNSQINIAEKVQAQVESVANFDVPYYVLTNDKSQVLHSDVLNIVDVQFERYPKLTMYFYRLFMVFNFLQNHPEIEKVALTDATDVTMHKNPFNEIEENKLYMGDEASLLFQTSIVLNNEDPQFIKKFIWENGHLPILNLGIMVGTRAVLVEYLGLMVKIIMDEVFKMAEGDRNAGVGNLEMSISNYVAYRYFANRLEHGRKVSTVFHAEEKIKKSWFKHK